MSKYRILSFDGGGVRGLITTVLMERLTAQLAKISPAFENWYQEANLFAGTSTGGLIALALTHKMTLAEIRDFYETKSPDIFGGWMHVDKLIRADYGNEVLESELKAILGDKTTLGQLDKRVLIATFDLDNGDPASKKYHHKAKSRSRQQPRRPARKWKPKIFHNFPGDDSDKNARAYKVGLYTSAAPTFFPGVDGFVDGGVIANNPSMCALTQTQDQRNADPLDKPRLEDVYLLSLGTGEPLQHITDPNPDWGYAQWGRPILQILLNGVTGMVADYQCRQLLTPERYHRLQPEFQADDGFGLDSAKPEEIQAMIQFAQHWDITETVDWLEQYWF